MLTLSMNTSNQQIKIQNSARMINVIRHITTSNQLQTRLENFNRDVQKMNHWK